jgi:glycosyltransferase involved in cell wall biosynthesis
MISIILVGQNEGWRLSKSLESAHNLKNVYPNYEFDIIYVDSRSTDDSLERVKSFPHTRVFEITGVTNSAIARNIGAKEAKGDILFFVDADMEIQQNFLQHALNDNGELKYDYLTGHLDDYFYTIDDEFIEWEPRTYRGQLPMEIQNLNSNGGLCIIKKKVWNAVGGMRNKYKRSQDLDLTIRLKNNGIKIIRIPFLAAKHHTIDYRNEKRMWKMLWAGYKFYSGLLIRDHFFNQDVLKRVIRSEYTALILFVLMLTFFMGQDLFLVAGTGYFLLLAIRTIIHTRKAKSKKNSIPYFFEQYLFQILLDISFWIGFLLFSPKNKNLNYNSVNI